MKNEKLETLILYIVMISVVGIVVILVLKELDIFTSDLTDTLAAIPSKLGKGIVSGASAIWNFLFGWIKTTPPAGS